jgi:basic membrane protein A and related proteins
MSASSKRSLLKTSFGLMAAAASLALIGCKPAPAPAPAVAPAASTAASAPAPAASGPLKIAFAYVGPVSDAGWTYAHDQGRKAIEKEFGDKVKTSFVESVPESADAERQIREMATSGNDVIFGTTFGYGDTMVKLAGEFPKIKFEHATGFKNAPNMRTYDSRTYEGAYLAGVIAGKMSKSGTLGVVASIPIPEVIRNINSFTMGAQTQNPKIKTKVVWIDKWFDPSKEAEAAQSLLNQGADVLFQNTDSTAVLQTAEKAGKFAFGWDSDMSKAGPNSHLASAIINWGPYYVKATRDALEGKWKQEPNTWWGVRNGAIDLVSISAKVPEETKKKVADLKTGLMEGTFHPWTGPIVDQAGKEVLPAGQTADDAFMSGIKFYVKGVEGSVPGGK